MCVWIYEYKEKKDDKQQNVNMNFLRGKELKIID